MHTQLHTTSGETHRDRYTTQRAHNICVLYTYTHIYTTHTYTKKNEQGNLIKNKETRAGEMAQQFRALVALAEGIGLVFIAHKAYNHL